MRKKLYLIKYWAVVIAMMAACSDESDPASDVNAEAGPDKNALIDQVVMLNGGASSATGGGALEYSWKILAKPASSTATIENETSEQAAITPDTPGRFTIELTVSTAATDMDTVNIYAYDVITVDGDYENLFPGPNVGVRQYQVYDGKLIATCAFTEIGGVEAKRIAQYDGSAWSAMGCGLEEGNVYDMIVYKDDLYVTGRFTEIGCVAANNIARWNGSEWSAVKGGLTGDDAFGYALAIFNNELYVAGNFTEADGIDVMNIAKWDGMNWSAAGELDGGSARSLEVYKQELYAGGFFTTADGKQSPYVAVYDGAGWSSPGSQGNLAFRTTGAVLHMAVFDDLLFLAGDIDINGTVVSQISIYNGAQFADLGKGFSLGASSIDELVAIDDLLFVAGSFQNVLGTQINNIVQFDGQKWGKLQQGINGNVFSMIQYEDQIFIGGEFDQAGGEAAEHIAIWKAE